MRVLKKGRSKDWKTRVDCNCCDARLEVSSADCSRVSDQRDGDFYSCKCPECGHHVTICARLVGR